MTQQTLYDLSPLLSLLLLGAALAALPVAWVWWRYRGAARPRRRLALTMLTLFLTFDLILVGAFTRLTDSGLGCPDWPGCYGKATPVGAGAHIQAAQDAMPTGPVTHQKAWIEMLHRYLATAVGALIVAMTWLAWKDKRKSEPGAKGPSVSWPAWTLVWVCLQGAFGALTVTMKLFPAIVSLHLLGAYVLLALLVIQAVQWGRAVEIGMAVPSVKAAEASSLRPILVAGLVLMALQASSGAWVSTNYAVLACTEFPMCQGSWWPAMDFAAAAEFWRPLGEHADGSIVSFQALTAIHVFHRLLAMVTLVALGAIALKLRRLPALKNVGTYLLALLGLQLLTGLSNVVLGWPMLAAILHTGGAGALVAVLVWALALLHNGQHRTAAQPLGMHA